MSIKLKNNAAITFAAQLLMAQNVPEDTAQAVAQHLVESDRAGYVSHGLSILPNYRKALSEGTLKGQTNLECLRNEGFILAFDAHLSFGQHAAKLAFTKGIERAKEYGMSVLTLRNAHHIGRTGYYGEMATSQGLALIAFTNIINRSPTVAPFGGAQARLTTNPCCIAWPMPSNRPPFLLDLATSAIALNKARVLAAKGEKAPKGSLLDAQGNPTQDPHVMLEKPSGALLPFGAHKGYGLGLAIELFAGILSGGGTIHAKNQTGNGMAVNNVFALLVDVNHFSNKDWAQSELETFVTYLKNCPPQPGFDEVQYSGEFEARNKEKYAQSIVLDDASWAALQQMGQDLNVAIPQVTLI